MYAIAAIKVYGPFPCHRSDIRVIIKLYRALKYYDQYCKLDTLCRQNKIV